MSNGTPNNEVEVFEPDIAGIRARIANILSDPGASAFVKDLMGRVSSDSNPVVEDGDLLKIFDKLTGPDQGGLRRSKFGGGRMNGSFQQGNATIELGKAGTLPPQFTPELRKDFQTWQDADCIIHELCHASGEQSYSDFQLAVAVSQMDNTPPLPDIPQITEHSTFEERVHAAVVPSTYWNAVLKEHCPSPDPPCPPGLHFGPRSTSGIHG
jgi:hypothetical protein